MADKVYIKEDLVSVTMDNGGHKVILSWGDPVEVLGSVGNRTQIRVFDRGGSSFTGTVNGKLPTQKKGVLSLSMVDVQQGDGLVLETPLGKKILIDGGDNKLFARYLAARYQNTSETKPLVVDAMVITHGDADHFQGLTEIQKSETHATKRKRLFLYPLRVMHNGLVKGPSTAQGKKVKDEKMFGATAKTPDGKLAVVALEEDLLAVPNRNARMNGPFKTWMKSLEHWQRHGPIQFFRVREGDDTPFSFLNDEEITVDVHGPLETTAVVNGSEKPALEFLHSPKKNAEIHLQEEVDDSRALSASHTINGHSLAFRLTYKNVRFYFSGDMNHESMNELRKRIRKKDLNSEILKVPHHGSADFDLQALKEISPVVSLISSGDESSRKEHIHPRATTMGAIGRASRSDTPIVFCTELAAFFEVRGLSTADKDHQRFFGFERTNFGIIQVRTDGERVLVFTHSGKENMKEAYRFTVDANHQIKFSPTVKTR